MRRPAVALAAVCALVLGTAACETRSQGDDPQPRPSSEATPADVSEHESGPQSPVAYGLQVPEGATQLGPLVRYRSPALIEAFQPELDAALARVEAEEERRRAEAEAEGTTPPTPRPTPETQPERDTFALIESPPKPDVTVSLMRIDGDPTEALRRMLVQVDALVEGSDLVLDDLGEYCESRDRRITSCRMQTTGPTAVGRDLRVTVSVDPGDVATRTASPSTQGNPVMVLSVEYVGDPRSGQLDPNPGGADLPQEPEGSDTSDLVWPGMDEEAPPSAPLLDGWVAPPEATILISADRPPLAAVATARVREAEAVARDWVAAAGDPVTDVVEDLNEISTTHRATDEDGGRLLATYVLSARGNYAMMFYEPPEEQ